MKIRPVDGRSGPGPWPEKISQEFPWLLNSQLPVRDSLRQNVDLARHAEEACSKAMYAYFNALYAVGYFCFAAR